MRQREKEKVIKIESDKKRDILTQRVKVAEKEEDIETEKKEIKESASDSDRKRRRY